MKQDNNTEMITDEREQTLSEIKTLLRVLNTWGNTLVPELDGKETSAQERLTHFVNIAQEKYGMSLGDIESAIA